MTIGSSTDNQNDDSLNAANNSDVENKTSGLENADSSTAQDANKPKDMESAVRSALGEPKEGQSSSPSDKSISAEIVDPTKVAVQDAQKPTDDNSDLTDVELSLLKPRTRKSIERMRGQLSELGNENQELKTRVQEYEQYKPAAEALGRFEGFCKEANLDKDDISNTLAIAKAVRNDPEKGLQLLIPVVNQLMEIVGAVLPADLNEKVDTGEISPQYAQELSQLRSREARNKENQEWTREQQRITEHQNSVKQLADTTGEAVSTLEKQWQTSDPDYRIKSTMVAEKIELELRKRQEKGNMPKNAQEAVELAKGVKLEVDNYFKKFLPKKSSVQTVLGVGTSTGSKPVPKNLKEAIQQSVGQ